MHEIDPGQNAGNGEMDLFLLGAVFAGDGSYSRLPLQENFGKVTFAYGRTN